MSIDEAIKKLTKKAAESHTAIEAMQLSQAILNLTQANHIRIEE